MQLIMFTNKANKQSFVRSPYLSYLVFFLYIPEVHIYILIIKLVKL